MLCDLESEGISNKFDCLIAKYIPANPRMSKSHQGVKLSALIMVGFCQRKIDDGDFDDDYDGQPECDRVDNCLEEKNRPQAFCASHHLLKACAHLIAITTS